MSAQKWTRWSPRVTRRDYRVERQVGLRSMRFAQAAKLEFRRQVQHPSALSHSIFLSPEPPSHLRNAGEGGGEEGKIRSFLGEPERPKVLQHFASECTLANPRAANISRFL
jgi:hypothetical protein